MRVLKPSCNGTLNSSNVTTLEFHLLQVANCCVRKLVQRHIAILCETTENPGIERIHHTEIREREVTEVVHLLEEEENLG